MFDVTTLFLGEQPTKKKINEDVAYCGTRPVSDQLIISLDYHG